MTDNPVELDEHRGMAAQKLTEIRRRLHEVQADQAALRRRQEEFECHALAAPSTTWAEAATREAALKAEQETRDAEFAERIAREAALEAERQAARDARYAARKARKRKGR